MAIQEVMTRAKNIYYQKMMGSCVSEGVKAIRRELLKARALLGYDSPAQQDDDCRRRGIVVPHT